MKDIYIIEYVQSGKTTPIAILEDIKFVNLFMASFKENACIDFRATHYKKEPCGVLAKIAVLDYSHLCPPSSLPRLRIPL